MSHYKHLTPKEREKILLLRSKQYSVTKIAEIIGRHKSTVSRELIRNGIDGEYSAVLAHALYKKRREACRPKHKLQNPELFHYVKDKFLNHQWSPEQIAGRLIMEGSPLHISYTTIYRGIYAGLFDTTDERKSKGNRGAIRKLRHKGKTRHTREHVEKRGKIIISNELKDRPVEANDRSRIGDWEGDTVAGLVKGPCLVTLTDRKSRFLLSRKAADKTAANVCSVLIDLLKEQPLYTITPDRGKEFSKHANVTKSLHGVQFYFPKPSHPWDRGTNENTNGLLREYFPKGTDLSKYSDEHIACKVDELNKRPRKCLGFKTPYEVFFSFVLHLT